jgi:hypothetical protein
MTWLTLHDAEQIGIEVLPFEGQAPATNPPERVVTSPESSGQELRSRALSFVTDVNSKWSAPNSAGLSWLDALYADEVDFYGKLISRGEVLTEKRLFTERWPERSYRIQPKSMNAACDARRPGFSSPPPQEVPIECIVTGTVEWETRSPARKAAAGGLAAFTYVLLASGGTFIIKGEHGSVLQRRTSVFSPPSAGGAARR